MSILNILNKTPYKEITETKSSPKKNFVLKSAKISNTFDTLRERICIKGKMMIIKITNASIENIPNAIIMIKYQKENPADTASALNLGDDNSILDRINECHQPTLD